VYLHPHFFLPASPGHIQSITYAPTPARYRLVVFCGR